MARMRFSVSRPLIRMHFSVSHPLIRMRDISIHTSSTSTEVIIVGMAQEARDHSYFRTRSVVNKVHPLIYALARGTELCLQS